MSGLGTVETRGVAGQQCPYVLALHVLIEHLHLCDIQCVVDMLLCKILFSLVAIEFRADLLADLRRYVLCLILPGCGRMHAPGKRLAQQSFLELR